MGKLALAALVLGLAAWGHGFWIGFTVALNRLVWHDIEDDDGLDGLQGLA